MKTLLQLVVVVVVVVVVVCIKLNLVRSITNISTELIKKYHFSPCFSVELDLRAVLFL